MFNTIYGSRLVATEWVRFRSAHPFLYERTSHTHGSHWKVRSKSKHTYILQSEAEFILIGTRNRCVRVVKYTVCLHDGDCVLLKRPSCMLAACIFWLLFAFHSGHALDPIALSVLSFCSRTISHRLDEIFVH